MAGGSGRFFGGVTKFAARLMDFDRSLIDLQHQIMQTFIHQLDCVHDIADFIFVTITERFLPQVASGDILRQFGDLSQRVRNPPPQPGRHSDRQYNHQAIEQQNQLMGALPCGDIGFHPHVHALVQKLDKLVHGGAGFFRRALTVGKQQYRRRHPLLVTHPDRAAGSEMPTVDAILYFCQALFSFWRNQVFFQ